MKMVVPRGIFIKDGKLEKRGKGNKGWSPLPMASSSSSPHRFKEGVTKELLARTSPNTLKRELGFPRSFSKRNMLGNDKDSDVQVEVKSIKSPKIWGVRQAFSRSNSPKLKRVDELQITNPFWENDYQYNFKIIDKTFFENYYSDESLLKENQRNKIFDETEFKRYDVKMNQLIELIKSSKDCLFLNGRLLDEGLIKYFIKNSNYSISTAKVILNRNSLTGEGALLLFKKIDETIISLEISHNFIFPVAGEAISRILTNAHSRLQNLSLTNCKIKDDSAKKLFFSIMLNRTLRVLKLSNNSITDNSADYIALILQQKSSLKEFYINWNLLTGIGASQIAEGLISNKTMKVLDLSFNKLGAKCMDSFSCAESIKSLLTNDSCGLIHLDLSHTNFSLVEAKIISEGLQKNHSLYGFHFEGNPGKMDIQGYLKFTEEDDNQKLAHFAKSYRPIEGVLPTYPIRTGNFFFRSRKDSLEKALNQSGNCWICEGWVEHTFEFFSPNRPSNYFIMKLNFLESEVSSTLHDPRYYIKEKKLRNINISRYTLNANSKTIKTKEDAEEFQFPCFIHLDLDSWQPFKMEFQRGRYSFKRLCPPREILYFFSFNGKQVLNSSDHIKENQDPSINVTINEESKQFLLPKLNTVTLEANRNFVAEDYLINVTQAPRSPITSQTKLFLYQMQSSKVPITKSVSKIFAGFEIDTETILKKCLAIDWKSCKFFRESKISTPFLKSLHDIILSVYSYIKDCHKSYSSLDPIKNSYFVMSKSSFNEFLGELSSSTKLNLKPEEINSIFEKSLNDGYRDWEKTAFTRAEFIEFLIRMANKIYVNELNLSSKFSAFLRDGLFAFLKNFHQQSFREEVLLSTNNGMVVDNNMRVIRYVFQKYARTVYLNDKYGEFLSLSEFLDIWRDCMENKNRTFLEPKETIHCFYMSQSTQILDISSKRHLSISLNEFVEAILRIAEKLKDNTNNDGDVHVGELKRTPSFSPKRQLSFQIKNTKCKLGDIHVVLERLIWNMGDLVEDPAIVITKSSLFECIECAADSSECGSPLSPLKIESPFKRESKKQTTILMKSKTIDLNANNAIRPINLFKKNYNAIVGLPRLPVK